MDLFAGLNGYASNALFAVAGGVVGFAAKEFIFPRLFENWKAKRELKAVYRKYRDPLFLATQEFANRIKEIVELYPTTFLQSNILALSPERIEHNSDEDDYFKKYKLVSSVYRLCAFLGWLEIYRQDIAYLDSGEDENNKNFEREIAAIRNDLADGHLNTARDFSKWKDHLIFREELRAVGDAMICDPKGGVRTVFGYREFSECFLTSRDPDRKAWFMVAAQLFFDLPKEVDLNFRYVRLNRLLVHLVNLMLILERTRVPQRLISFVEEMKRDPKKFPTE